MFKLEIQTDNAAFEDNPRQLVQLIHRTADKLESGDTSGVLMDDNGNTVGEWSLNT